MKQRASRILTGVGLFLIQAYRVGLRPLNPWGCKFQPSCSAYAAEALRLHGPARGGWLALQRLLRCRPGVFGGWDPVPEADIPAGSIPEGGRQAT